MSLTDDDIKFMKMAYEEARIGSEDEGGIPIGSVLVDKNGNKQLQFISQ
jgi:tRNA(Arg) A34 adenosine deaminase TadA